MASPRGCISTRTVIRCFWSPWWPVGWPVASWRAVHYLRQAADNALHRYANAEAIDHLTTGLALLQTLPHAHEYLPGPRGGPWSAGQSSGVARRYEPGAAVAAGQATRGVLLPGGNLQVVH